MKHMSTLDVGSNCLRRSHGPINYRFIKVHQVVSETSNIMFHEYYWKNYQGKQVYEVLLSYYKIHEYHNAITTKLVEFCLHET